VCDQKTDFMPKLPNLLKCLSHNLRCLSVNAHIFFLVFPNEITAKIQWNVVEIYELACRGAFTTLFLIFGGWPLSSMHSGEPKLCKQMQTTNEYYQAIKHLTKKLTAKLFVLVVYGRLMSKPIITEPIRVESIAVQK
jgi:hypothetical protein